MAHFEDENKYLKISKLLKDLPKVNAPANFETELSRRLKKEEHREETQTWIEKIFSPRLIPSAALAVTAVIILFLLKGTVGDVDDPFQEIPKLREKLTMQQYPPSESVSNQIVDRKQQNFADEINGGKDNYTNDSNILSASASRNTSLERISVSTINYKPDQAAVTAGGLNFRIVKIDDNERKQLEILREKIGAETQNLH